MTITVRYYAQLRRLAEVAAEVVFLDEGVAVRDLLRTLATRRPPVGPLLLGDDAHKRASLLVFVNDEQANDDRALGDSDEVLLITPIAGGA